MNWPLLTLVVAIVAVPVWYWYPVSLIFLGAAIWTVVAGLAGPPHDP